MTRQRNNRRPREGRADRVEQFTRQGSEAQAAEGSDRAPRSSLDMGRQGSRRAATARWRNQRSRGGIVMDHEPARVSTVVPTCAFLMILQTPSRGELHCCNSLWDLIKKSSSDASRLGVGARKPRQRTVSSLSASGPRGSPRDNRVPDVTQPPSWSYAVGRVVLCCPVRMGRFVHTAEVTGSAAWSCPMGDGR
jgi:hypothetical protein